MTLSNKGPIRKALYGYNLASKKFADDNKDKKVYRDWPPYNLPKYLDEVIISSLEIIDHYSQKDRCYLYAQWPDGIVYLSDWRESELKNFLGPDHAALFKTKKRRKYSDKLAKELLKGAKPYI